MVGCSAAMCKKRYLKVNADKEHGGVRWGGGIDMWGRWDAIGACVRV